MAKKKSNTEHISGSIEPVKTPEPVFSFPTKVRCPRCGGMDTIAQHTDSKNGRQYRKCQRAICRWKFSVQGKKV